MAKKDEPVSEVEEKEETPLEEPKEEKQEPEPQEETPEPEQSEEEPKEEPSGEEEGEEQAPPEMSRRKAKRLDKLESLVSRLKGDEEPTKPSPQGMDYRTELQADDDVVERLEADRKAATQSSFNEGLERAKSIQFHTRLEIDAPRIEGKYPLFNKESEDFNSAAANSINNWYLASVGYDPKSDTVANPNVRYADFVEGIMELADSMAGVKVETTQKNIVKQAANTGIRPDGSTSKLNLNKLPHEMTDAELNAAIKASLK